MVTGEDLKAAREQRRIPKARVARHFNITTRTLARWEQAIPEAALPAVEKYLADLDARGSAGPTLAEASDAELAMEFLRRMQARTGPPPGSKDKAWAPAAPPPFEVENPPLAEST